MQLQHIVDDEGQIMDMVLSYFEDLHDVPVARKCDKDASENDLKNSSQAMKIAVFASPSHSHAMTSEVHLTEITLSVFLRPLLSLHLLDFRATPPSSPALIPWPTQQ